MHLKSNHHGPVLGFFSQFKLRQLFLTICAFALTNLSCSTAPKKIPLIQGITDESSTQISYLVPKEQKVEAVVVENQTLRLHFPVRIQIGTRNSSPWKVVHTSYKGLSNTKDYSIKLTTKEEDQEIVLDQRAFSLVNPNKNTVRFVVASCMDDTYAKEQVTQWSQVHELDPDMIFMIGDNVYADKGLAYVGPAPPDLVWDRYVETRNLLEIFKKPKLIPVLATWDDHDYGANDSDRSYPHRHESLKTFNSFFPQSVLGSRIEKGPGVSFAYSAYGHRFIFLDNRYFRAPKNDTNGTHLGDRQEKWLFSLLRQRAVPTFIIQGDQFIGKYHPFESLQGLHPKAYERFRKKVSESKSPVVLISGDRHRSEITKLSKERFGYETYEITSSPIHAKTFPGGWKDHHNPHQIAGYEDRHNFLVIESSATSNGMNLKVKGYNDLREEIMSSELTVKR